MLGYTRGAWATPIRTPPPPPPPAPVVRTVAPLAPVAPPRATNIPVYDPSRIFKDIRVVKDIRQQGTERGETQSGDGRMLGPFDAGGIAPPQTKLPVAPGAPGKNNLVPIALAVAAFILLGG